MWHRSDLHPVDARPRRGPARRGITLLLTAVAVAAGLLAGCSGGSDDGAASSTSSTAPRQPSTGDVVDLRPLHVEEQRIVDDRGRQVLLRGANVNGYGEYHQADPEVAPTAPVTNDDWDAMAANGFSVVRLIMSWSRLEPKRGKIDQDYLDEIQHAVESANARGIYVVLDMHQDAWGMDSATPAGTTCPDGTQPVIGWDGAPSWATISDGATTCRASGTERETAPMVQRAFANFYADTDGIASQLTDVWAAVAERFTGTPGVAGYDLLNEPNAVPPLEQNQVAYSQWLQRTIDAIRATESGHEGGGAGKPIFVEPLQLYPLPNNAILPQYVHDDDLVFAPHNYAESIYDFLTVEQNFQIDHQGAVELDAAMWIGEYGFWNIEPDTLAVAARYAAAEDSYAVGGAWWQWRQTCGDPHSVGGPGIPATEDQVHLITRACTPEAGEQRDTDLRYTTEFLRILGRAFPRAAPGRISQLTSDPATGGLTVVGTGAATGAELVVWLPERIGADGKAADDLQPTDVVGLDDVELKAVHGGRILTATAAAADWTLVVGGPVVVAPSTSAG